MRNYRFVPPSEFNVLTKQSTGAFSVVASDNSRGITDLTLSSAARFGSPLTYRFRRTLPFHMDFRRVYDYNLNQFVREAPDSSNNSIQVIDTTSLSLVLTRKLDTSNAQGSVVTTYKVISKGSSAISELKPGFGLPDGTNFIETTETFGLVVLNRLTQVVEFNQSYATESDKANSKLLADKLQSLDSTKIVVLTTKGDPSKNLTVELIMALVKVGATPTTIQKLSSGSSYALLGIPSSKLPGFELAMTDITSIKQSVIESLVVIDKGSPVPYFDSNSAGSTLISVNRFDNKITIANEFGEILKTHNTPSRPYAIELYTPLFAVDSMLAVSYPEENKVRIHEIDTFNVLREIPTDAYPMGLCVKDTALYVACYKGRSINKIVVGNDGNAISRVSTVYGGVNCTVLKDGTVAIALYDHNRVFYWHPNGQTSFTRVGDGPLAIMVDTSGCIIVTSTIKNSLFKIDQKTYQVIGVFATGNYPSELAIDSNGYYYILNYEDDQIQILNNSSGELITQIRIPRLGYGLASNSNGSKIFVSSYASNYSSRLTNPHNLIRNYKTQFGTEGLVSNSLPIVISSTNEDVPKGAGSTNVWLTTSKVVEVGEDVIVSPGLKIKVNLDVTTPSTSAGNISIYLRAYSGSSSTDTLIISQTSVQYWTTIRGEYLVPEGVDKIKYIIKIQSPDDIIFSNRWYFTNLGLKVPSPQAMVLDTISNDANIALDKKWAIHNTSGQWTLNELKPIKPFVVELFIPDIRSPKLTKVRDTFNLTVHTKKTISLADLMANTRLTAEILDIEVKLGQFNEVVVVPRDKVGYIEAHGELPRGMKLSDDRKSIIGSIINPGYHEISFTLSTNRSVRLRLRSKLYRTTSML